MNPQTPPRDVVVKRSLLVGSIVVVGLCVYVLFWSIINGANTGTLRASSSNPKATLSISQPDHQAKAIGIGHATVHLSPGSYQVRASYGSGQANATVSITKKHTTNLFLSLKNKPVLPSPANINFPNIDSLTDSGITSTQINILERDFFQFKQTSQKVSIVNSSISPAPHNPNVDTSFTINFKVNVDSTPYNAAVNYSDLDNIRLLLHNPQNNVLVFDSYAINTVPTE